MTGTPEIDASLAAFIREHEQAIAAEWKQRAPELSSTHRLERPVLFDEICSALELVADLIDEGSAGGSPDRSKSTAESRVPERLVGDADIGEVIREYSLLRECILRQGRGIFEASVMASLSALNRAFDQALAAWVDRHTALRDRKPRVPLARTESAEAAANPMPILVAYLDPELRYRFSNKAYEAWFGRPSREILGKHVREVMGEAAWEQLMPCFEAVSSGQVMTYQQEIRGEAGRSRWVEATYTPDIAADGSLAGFVAIVSDVSERRRIEEEQRFLKEATAALASSLDYRETLARITKLAVPVLADWCAVEIATNGETEQLAVEHVEPAKVELAQELRRRYPPDPQAPRGVPHVLRTARPEIYRYIPDELLVQSAVDLEHLEILRTLGLSAAMVVPMVAHGRSIGAISFVSAESGRRYTDHDLEVAQELAARAALALDNARLFREAQDAALAREAILAVVSHDLKNPLAAIQLATALLTRRQGDARERKWIETIQRSASHMDHLIADLLDTASIQAGRLALETKRESADALLSEALEAHEAAVKEKGIRLERSCRLEGIELLCDRERVLQVLGNLLGNAIKFCRSGDLIRVGGKVLGHELRFAVADTGPGIPEADLPHIFEAYWSAEKHATKGTGLGLHIAKGIVEAHGGRMWVESHRGRGATFFFTLKLAEGRSTPPKMPKP